MSEPLYADSLFVGYGRDIPREERIPYTSGAALTPEVLSRLIRHILIGRAQSVQMDDATGENALEADFRDGWATVYIVRNGSRYYELVNPEAPDDETPLSITGNGPTPKKHATEDIPLLAEIIDHFAKTGEPLPKCLWEESIH